MNAGESKAPQTLAERFWSLARGMESASDSTEPVRVTYSFHLAATGDQVKAHLHPPG